MERQDQTNQFIYPVSFEDFVNYRKKQSEAVLSSYSVKQFSKLRKLKKLLQSTQQKICNRIKLFKKVSVDLQKKKQKQNQLHERIQNLRKNGSPLQQLKNIQNISSYMKSTKSSASGLRIKQINEIPKAQCSNSTSSKNIIAIQQQKYDNAKQIKMWKQRNKIFVQQRKLKQMRDKVKSANIIRSNRNKAKQVKFQCEQQRLEEARKQKQQKFIEEVGKYDELQSNLTKLQREEREALIMWKKALQQSQSLEYKEN